MKRRAAAAAHLTRRRIDPAKVVNSVKDELAGGVVLFLGTVRSVNEGRSVERLEYQAYRTMAEKKIREIEAEVRDRWPVQKVKILHREGSLPVGEISVAVAVSSEHREEAFEACRYAIATVKHSVPVWKREKIVGGGERWVEGEPIREARTRATPSRESAAKQVA
jgi:molybdopterin synthase catalytic subunit